MTNEQLAALIYEGENNELLPLLWEKTRKLFHMFAADFYKHHVERCASCGVTLDDLKQEGYLAMSEAVAAYGARPDESSALLFSSFCNYPFKNRANALIGLRTKRQKNEPLNNCRSLDEPICSDSGDEIGSLVDIVTDEAASLAFDDVDNKLYTEQAGAVLHEEVDKLPKKEAEAVRLRFFSGQTLRQCAESMGISMARVRQIEYNALKMLRRSRAIRQLQEFSYYRHSSAASCARHGSSVELAAEQLDRLRSEAHREESLAIYKKLFGVNVEIAEKYATTFGIHENTNQAARCELSECEASNSVPEGKTPQNATQFEKQG